MYDRTQTHHQDALKGIGTALLQDSLPAVLAMQYSILDESGGVGKTALTAKIIEKVKQDKSVEAVCVIRCDKIEPTFANIIEKVANFISYQGKEGHAQAGQLLKESRIAIDERISLLNNAIKDDRYLFIFDNFESLFVGQAPCGELRDEDLTRFFSSIFDHNWHSTFVFTCRYEWPLLSEKGLLDSYLHKSIKSTGYSKACSQKGGA